MRGTFTMNEVKRIAIIQSVLDKKRTQKEASEALNLSERQIRKIVKRYREEGVEGIKHKNKTHKPVHTFSKETREKIVELKKSDDYIETNISHFRDLLEERENIKISYSALYNMLKEAGIKSKKSHRDKKTHRRRKRKEAFGMLVQTDGTPYDWFGIGKKYSLHGYVDDATGKILGLYMCEHECLLGYLEITRQMLTNYGTPLAIYSDKYSVFFPAKSQKVTVEEELEGKRNPTTQFGRIMEVLGITLIPASTSQAKGRIERLWETLQDRLTTEFKINNINTIEEANKFLIKYIDKYNKRFSVEPITEENKFIPIPSYIDLDLLLSVQFTRVIDNGGIFSIKTKKFQIVNNDIMPKAKVTIYMSHKIGIIVEYNKKRYKVVCLDNVPSTYSTLTLNKFCKEYEIEVKEFATEMCSYNSKEISPLLVTS